MASRHFLFCLSLSSLYDARHGDDRHGAGDGIVPRDLLSLRRDLRSHGDRSRHHNPRFRGDYGDVHGYHDGRDGLHGDDCGAGVLRILNANE